MNAVSPTTQSLAQQILVHEAGGRQEPVALADAMDAAIIRLRARLADLIGQTGFDTLLARALRLATAEHPALGGIAIDSRPGGGLIGTRAFVLAGTPDEAETGLLAILSQVIELLIVFLGDDLGLRLVRGAWPELERREAGSPAGRHEHES